MTEDAETPVWIDAETQVAGDASHHRAELRLWLRLLTCSTLIETEVRRRLRDGFGFTLPRFDLLAQLDRAEDGLVLGEISRRLMVSAGNVTALVERLAEGGYITRSALATDRRVQVIRMTPEGRRRFREMADRHGEWIGELFAGLSADDGETLMTELAKLKTSVRASSRHEGMR